MNKILPYLILFSALSVSGSAAFYSVYGLSKLFAGASTQVIIMASSLEIAKLVIATLLHKYWDSINTLLKVYLTIATVTLVLITSAGIYGFLSNAYQLTANKDKIVTRGIELVDTKQQVFEQSKLEYTTEKESIVKSISELRNSLANPGQVQFVDKKTGKVITSTSNDFRARKSLEIQLDDAIKRRDELTKKIQIVSDSIGKFEVEKIQLENNSDAAAELGPLKYISGLTGLPMDRVVNYFLILIIFVFDPLAIALVLAASFAFDKMKQTSPKTNILNVEEKNTTPEISEQKKTEVDTNSDHIAAVEKIYNTIQSKRKTNPKKVKERRVVKFEADGNIGQTEDVTYDEYPELQPDLSLHELPDLSPEQIRNMSHEAVENYLKIKNSQ
jgi:hypothetical protein